MHSPRLLHEQRTRALAYTSPDRGIQPARATRNNAITHRSLIVPSIVAITAPLYLPAPEHPSKRLLVLLDLRAEVPAVPIFVVLWRELGVAFYGTVDG